MLPVQGCIYATLSPCRMSMDAQLYQNKNEGAVLLYSRLELVGSVKNRYSETKCKYLLLQQSVKENVQYQFGDSHNMPMKRKQCNGQNTMDMQQKAHFTNRFSVSRRDECDCLDCHHGHKSVHICPAITLSHRAHLMTEYRHRWVSSWLVFSFYILNLVDYK